jgi:hypothetical protein
LSASTAAIQVSSASLEAGEDGREPADVAGQPIQVGAGVEHASALL